MNAGSSSSPSRRCGGAGVVGNVGFEIVIEKPRRGAGTLPVHTPHVLSVHLDLAVVFFPIDNPRDLLGLLAVSARDRELMFALLAIPHRVLAAERHRHANLSRV